MKKLIVLLFATLTLGGQSIFGKTYYELMTGSATGSITMPSSGSSSFDVSDSYVSWYTSVGTYDAKYKSTNSSGDRIYRTPTNDLGMYTVVAVSPNKKFMSLTVYWNGEWSMTRWLCDSESVKQKFYAENKNIQNSGIKYETILDYDSSSSSSSSKSSTKKKSSPCSVCGGTRVDPFPSSGGSIHSFVRYYNSPRNDCPYCDQYDSHFHDKCTHCE